MEETASLMEVVPRFAFAVAAVVGRVASDRFRVRVAGFLIS
jgi:hypothetical protein